MSRIKELFEKKQDRILNVYCTAGYPQLNSTIEVMKALQNAGADIIELGMPYSDPLADGPVIQASGAKALQNGMTISRLFGQLKDFRISPPTGGDGRIPVILMGYLNPLLQYGFEKFCKKASEAGIDGLIIPDLPEYEFEHEYRPIVEKYGLDFIFLVTPETSEERIKKLDSLSSGFLYAVSSSSLTGSEKDFSTVEKYLQRLQAMNLKNPVLVGFGIKDRASFESACRYANGAIVGSAYIKALENATDIEYATREFLKGVIN
ncbi:MAG TPA: tryptophan synthase subunit alpha [Chitinophagaceae bacterium]|nr:tryptophan synthase subunit alpha [Chitinophagaceae bacterium]